MSIETNLKTPFKKYLYNFMHLKYSKISYEISEFGQFVSPYTQMKEYFF